MQISMSAYHSMGLEYLPIVFLGFLDMLVPQYNPKALF